LLANMTTFDAATESKLATLEPLFRMRVRLFLLAVRNRLGLSPLITSARRTAQQQAALHLVDKRNPAPDVANPDVHQRGIAFDVDFADAAGKLVLLKGSSAQAWGPVVAIADSFKLTWGGRFRGYPDNNHFDGR
jgi:hypothetical protein